MDHAEQQANTQLESIVQMIAALRVAADDEQRDTAQTRIQEDPLSIEVRSAWYQPGEPGVRPNEFKILLCTGGPAVRIIGQLNAHGEPEQAQIEHQDWFTPWTPLPHITEEENTALLDYCRHFYFV